MARIPTLELQISNMKSLLRTMCDRVHAGLLVVEQHLHVPNTEALIKVVALDSEVDRMEQELDDAVLQIFATQQPRAQELRLVYATAKIAHHIERMGDAVESLARQLATADLSESRSLLKEMITHVKDLFARSYSAMFEEDHSGIQEIFDLDDAVDECQRAIVQIAKDMVLSAPRSGSRGTGIEAHYDSVQTGKDRGPLLQLGRAVGLCRTRFGTQSAQKAQTSGCSGR